MNAVSLLSLQLDSAHKLQTGNILAIKGIQDLKGYPF